MESMSALVRKWRNASAKMQKLAADMPRIAGKECVAVVKENFDLQGYDSGVGIEPWEQRDPKTNAAYDRGRTVNSRGQKSRYRTGRNATFKGSVYNSANPILEQTRNLKNSPKYRVAGKVVIIGILSNSLGPVLDYAKKMNEGGNGTPARQYMPRPIDPPNPKMLKGMKKKVEFERGKAMRDFVKYK